VRGGGGESEGRGKQLKGGTRNRRGDHRDGGDEGAWGAGRKKVGSKWSEANRRGKLKGRGGGMSRDPKEERGMGGT